MLKRHKMIGEKTIPKNGIVTRYDYRRQYYYLPYLPRNLEQSGTCRLWFWFLGGCSYDSQSFS